MVSPARFSAHGPQFASAGEATQARALAALFASGATLALLTLALPHDADAEALWMAMIIGAAYAAAVGIWIVADRIGTGLLEVALAFGTTLITAVSYLSGEAPSPLIFFYLWIFLYSAYFFDHRGAVLQIGYAGVSLGALLIAVEPSQGALPWWIVTFGTLLIGTALAALVREQADSLFARLREAAISDPLTGLMNRRGFREILDLELERSRRTERPVTVLLGELDHFEALADRRGNRSGEEALKIVAGLLEGTKRRIDSGARIGDREFALILPDSDSEGAMRLAERIRLVTRETFASQSVPLTFSIGIVEHPEHAMTAAGMLSAADDALHAAKESGRNRCIKYDPQLGATVRSPGSESIEEERFIAVMLSLAEASDLRFSGTARHSETVGRYAELTARELGMPEHHVGRVRLAGLLHDIGKVAISDGILHKPGKLSDEEYEQIKQHPGIGEQILEHPGLEDIRTWVGAHHERPDGRGYPRGMEGEQIPVEAQILAVADAFEAMTSVRSYRQAVDFEEALEELIRCRDSQFRGTVVDAFVDATSREDAIPAALSSST